MVQQDGSTDDAGITMEAVLPQSIAEDGYRASVHFIAALSLGNRPAQHRLDAEHREVVGGYQLAPDAVGVIAFSNGHGHRSSGGEGDQLEVIAVVAKIGQGRG